VAALAVTRDPDVNFPLFLHVLGASVLVGALMVVASAILLGWRRADAGDAVAMTRFGLRALLFAVVPAYIVMRIGAHWTEAAEDLPEQVEDQAWLGIGYITADAGAVLIIVSIALAAIALRRLRRGAALGLGRAVGVIAVVLLAAYLVAMWAMTAKPS
jgi:hypothetical protein